MEKKKQKLLKWKQEGANDKTMDSTKSEKTRERTLKTQIVVEKKR